MLGKMIENTKDLNMVADRLRARGEISRLQELCKEWLIPEKDMQDFLQGKRLRLAEVPLEEKFFLLLLKRLRKKCISLKDQAGSALGSILWNAVKRKP